MSVPALAQVDRGRIAGTVKDQTGAVIPGVEITVRNDRTGEERKVVSADKGDYLVVALKPSRYTVSAELSGFAKAEVPGVQLVVGQTLTLDLTLKAAGVTQELTVSADAAEVRVETSSASLGANVDTREVASLPINGRQLSQLYLQAPGAQNTGNGQYGDIRFNGRATEQNAIRYDGIEASGIVDAEPGVVGGELSSPFKLQSSLENVQEFRVESNAYGAEFGTGSGSKRTCEKPGSSRDRADHRCISCSSGFHTPRSFGRSELRHLSTAGQQPCQRGLRRSPAGLQAEPESLTLHALLPRSRNEYSA